MNTFKQAAIKILKKSGKPLHFQEITKLALEEGILRMSHPLLKFSEGFLLTAFYTASATLSTVVFDSLPSA